MRIGIMQPYFFPYLGHYALISCVDEWVVFDITQYQPRSWMNRNRVLHPNSGWQYLTVPLQKSSKSILTSEALVNRPESIKNVMISKLQYYQKRAPFYNNVLEIIEETFFRFNNNSLVSLNIQTIKSVCDYLSIPFSYKICSELKLNFPNKMTAGDWAPCISHQLGASEYVNPMSGQHLFDIKTFQRYNITPFFAEFSQFNYEVPNDRFIPNLSILDVLMWNDVFSVQKSIENNLTLHSAVDL